MLIRFIKPVVFRDRHDVILKRYDVGDTCEATYEHTDLGYFVTSMGGIFFSEAEKVG